MEEAIMQAVHAFALPEGEIRIEAHGNGHINRTYKVTVEGDRQQYILQWINQYVFHQPIQVQENILAVTNHLRQKIREEGGDPDRETLRVILTKDGKPCYHDGEDNWWRIFPFVEGTYSRDLPDTPALFEKCGSAFGRFQRRLDDFPAESLHETIPNFHNTPWRVEQLEAAARKDAAGRLKEVREELDFCLKQTEWTSRLTDGLKSGALPLRVTHNDTKLNNVLLDEKTEEAICVVDLDTVMPGLIAYDYGEAIRTGACTAPEDERDLSRIDFSLPLVHAYTRGFLRETGKHLSETEIRSLPWGARMMTLENGIRFLTDYLDGDHYFAIHRPKHNLERAQAQLTLLKKMEERWEELLGALEA
jgi:Ser/Thr protein kinase RdoA (MazF antagonist)